jgi:hypothetical protein
MALTIPPDLEQRLVALAESTWRNPQDVLDELLRAALRDDAIGWRLQAAIQAGDDSGIAADFSFETLRAEIDAERELRVAAPADPIRTVAKAAGAAEPVREHRVTPDEPATRLDEAVEKSGRRPK